jgi:alanine racemase
MHTNSIIELNNTAYQKNLFSPNHFWKKSTNHCKGNAYGHGVTEIVSMAYKTGLPISVFDVEKQNQNCDNATILVMGLVQDDMEWVINNDVEFLF